MRRYLVLALLVAVCPLAFAQAYKWKDAQGVTHYSDSPPPAGTKVETIKTSGVVVPPAGPAAAPAPAASAAKAPAGTVVDNPANRAKLCDQLKKNMDVLGTQAVVSMDDGKGGSQQLDPNARKRQIDLTQAQMTIYCK
ncbi:MAG: DUF4124 domain-containing protein [Luteibacter sp.]